MREPIAERAKAFTRQESFEDDPPPPVLGTWPRVYAAVAIYLVVLIVLFGVFTAVFNK